jgi:alkaline phosphatase
MASIRQRQHLQRREFLKTGSVVFTPLFGAGLFPASDNKKTLRVGLLTDLHYADKSPAGTRCYRETLDKLDEAAIQFKQSSPDFIVELGDFIDAADAVDVELKYLKTVNSTFSQICNQRHYVLGNHCVDTLHKEEFLAAVERDKSYYSFDQSGVHFVILDACFRSDGQPYGRRNFEWTDANIPPAELEWLRADLNGTPHPVIVFAHQRLDVSSNHGVKNCAEVRRVLEASKKVLAVFQGHSHQNDLNLIEGIHYCTLVAMVEGSGAENSGYSLLEISPDGNVALQGFRKQQSRSWPLPSHD